MRNASVLPAWAGAGCGAGVSGGQRAVYKA